MNPHITMSRAGVRALIRLTREQHHHHRAIWDFTRDTDLYESRVFGHGFLARFQGDYASAADDVFAGMGTASSGTARLVERMDQARDDIEVVDVQVDLRMTRLTEVREGVQVPELATRYAGVMSLGAVEKPGKHRAPTHEGSAANTIDAVSSLLSMGHHTAQTVSGARSGDELGAFVAEHAHDTEDRDD